MSMDLWQSCIDELSNSCLCGGGRGQWEWIENEWEVNTSLEVLCSS